jgi:ribose-phosphate pyrophosphokinase
MVKLLINEQEVKFETTVFPDGTSQVWKLQDDIDFDEYADTPVILWLFENESELMQVLQLAHLVQVHLDTPDCTLRVPYLPYGRQDKQVDNKLSFALQTFKDVLYHANITRIETFDAHSKSDMVYEDSVMPTVHDFHDSIFNQDKHDVICFPDAGAASRYKKGFYGLPVVYCEKIRDQLTGNILGLKAVGETDVTGQRVLIVDDICDGGMTFIKVAEALKPFNPKQVDLAVSHGLFSKGRQVLHDAGITDIYTTNSLLRNPEGFKVW